MKKAFLVIGSILILAGLAVDDLSAGGRREAPDAAGAVDGDEGFADVAAAFAYLGVQPLDGRPAEDFSLTDVDGNPVRLTDFAGQVVFLNFWATWCGPCKEEMPLMQELYDELGPEGFAVVAVNFQETAEMAGEYIAEYGYTYPVPVDASGTVSRRYTVRGLPTSYFIDRQGRMVGGKIGQIAETPGVYEAFRTLVEGL